MSTRDEQQRVCATCGHPKRGHELPRAEGGYGGGSSGRCVTYGCNCNRFEPTESFVEQAYTGDAMPKWVADGVKVKVKRVYKDFSIRVSGGSSADNYAHAGEVGTIRRRDGIGWWDWEVSFARGRHTNLTAEMLAEELIRVRR